MPNIEDIFRLLSPQIQIPPGAIQALFESTDPEKQQRVEREQQTLPLDMQSKKMVNALNMMRLIASKGASPEFLLGAKTPFEAGLFKGAPTGIEMMGKAAESEEEPRRRTGVQLEEKRQAGAMQLEEQRARNQMALQTMISRMDAEKARAEREGRAKDALQLESHKVKLQAELLKIQQGLDIDKSVQDFVNKYMLESMTPKGKFEKKAYGALGGVSDPRVLGEIVTGKSLVPERNIQVETPGQGKYAGPAQDYGKTMLEVQYQNLIKKNPKWSPAMRNYAREQLGLD